MEKGSGKFTNEALIFVLWITGAFFIYCGMPTQQAFRDVLGEALLDEVVCATAGAAIMLLLVLRTLSMLTSPKETFINFETEGGNVGINVKAVQDFVERVGDEFNAVKRIKCQLIRNKEKLNISIRASVDTGCKIPELSVALQQKVRLSLNESLGLEDIGDISIQVDQIVAQSAKKDA